MFGIPKEFFGRFATLASLDLFCLGMPKQIYDNYKTKSCHGSKVLQISLVIVYLFWTLYGFSIPDKLMILFNTPGLLVGLVLCFQFVYYRKGDKV